MRGASFVSHSDCAETMTCISRKRRSGSFCTLTSTLNFTCWFSGWQNLWTRERTYDICSKRTFISSATVSANVGMVCLGSFLVRRCCIPSLPDQFRSRINPGLYWSLVERAIRARNMYLSNPSSCQELHLRTLQRVTEKGKEDHWCRSPGS